MKTMCPIFIRFAIPILTFLGCKNDSADAPASDRQGDTFSNVPVQESDAASPTLDFDDLYKRLTKLKSCEISDFQSNWPSICAELRELLATGQLQEIPIERQEAISIELDYLRSCYHPDVLQRYGEQISDITKQLKLGDELQKFVDPSEHAR